MTKEDCLKASIDAQDNNDTEMAHELADTAICAFLSELGHNDLVIEYDKVSKCYA